MKPSPKDKEMKYYGILDSKGNLMSDFRSRVGFRSKPIAKQVAIQWRGKVVELQIKIK